MVTDLYDVRYNVRPWKIPRVLIFIRLHVWPLKMLPLLLLAIPLFQRGNPYVTV